jgi:hypothetical protein
MYSVAWHALIRRPSSLAQTMRRDERMRLAQLKKIPLGDGTASCWRSAIAAAV